MFAPALAYGGAYGAYGPYAGAGYGYGAFPGAYGLGMWNQQQGHQHAPAMHLQNLDLPELTEEEVVTASMVVGSLAMYCSTHVGECSQAVKDAANGAKQAFAAAKTAAQKIAASKMAQKAKALAGRLWNKITGKGLMELQDAGIY